MNFEEIVPEKIKTVQRYVPGKTKEEIKERYRPKKISKLASNENRLGCSPKVKKAINRSIQALNNYPDPIARQLRKKIAELHQVSESEILLAAGSESVISILCRTFFKDDENAVTAAATFIGFFVQAGVRGVELKKVPLTDDYRIDVDAILNAIDPKTKTVYIANPNNPTGTYINREEYSKLCSEIPENVLLIMDEAYHEFAESVEDYPNSLLNRPKNVITLRTFSKAYGLAGMRIGYAVAEEPLIREMMKTKLTFEPTTLAQTAASAALGDQPFIKKSVRTVAQGRQRLYDFLERQNLDYVPSISNSVMIIMNDESQAKTFTENMMKQGVILRQADAFGLPNCIRITIGTDENMTHFEESYMNLVHTSK